MNERLVAGALALVGALIATRLTAYQLGWTGPPWEPFFGDGARRVLHSSISRAFPFPDAALGLFAYLAETVAIVWVGTRRGQANPWASRAYAVIAVGLALGSAGLVAAQAAFVHAYCTLCLSSAVLSWVLAVPAVIELVASRRARRARRAR